MRAFFSSSPFCRRRILLLVFDFMAVDVIISVNFCQSWVSKVSAWNSQHPTQLRANHLSFVQPLEARIIFQRISFREVCKSTLCTQDIRKFIIGFNSTKYTNSNCSTDSGFHLKRPQRTRCERIVNITNWLSRKYTLNWTRLSTKYHRNRNAELLMHN